MAITARQIQEAIGYPELEPVRKVWVRLFGNADNWPQGDDPIEESLAVQLLETLATPTTRRTPEKAAIASDLLRQLRENGSVASPNAAQTSTRQKQAKTRTKTRKARTGNHAPLSDEIPAIIQEPKKPGAFKRFGDWLQSITALDIVYATTIATAAYGLWFNLKEMGAAFAIPYTLISAHALRMAKNPESRKTARLGIAAVAVLEILTFFIHLSMFNLRVVQIAKAGALPFEYSFWGSLEAPFMIALVLSILFSGSGFYAVFITYSLTTEKVDTKKADQIDAENREHHYAQIFEALKESTGYWTLASGWNEHRPHFAERLAEKYSAVINQAAPAFSQPDKK